MLAFFLIDYIGIHDFFRTFLGLWTIDLPGIMGMD